MANRQASLYDMMKARPGLLEMTEINPDLATRFMACVDRVIMFAEKKKVNIKDVCITGPGWDGENMVFKVKYGKENP